MKFDPATLDTLVVKIGTNLLKGRLAFEGQVMEAVVKDLCQLKRDHDINILIVSSGAVGCGMNSLGMTERPEALPIKQAVAAVGQATLLHYYETLFRMYGGDGMHAAQILLTQHDLDDREGYLNVRNTLGDLIFRRAGWPRNCLGHIKRSFTFVHHHHGHGHSMQRLPYPMQFGSGTWDVLTGLTFKQITPGFTWGIQWQGVFQR